MNKKLLSFALALSLVGSSYATTTEQKVTSPKEVLKAAIAAAEKEYPKHGVKKAILNNIPTALAGTVAMACCQIGLLKVINPIKNFLHRNMNGPCQHNSPEHQHHHAIFHRVNFAGNAISHATATLVILATHELWKQHRETKKNKMIIEHLVRHFAEYQDELNDDQIAAFAALITEYNEKKTLDIKNPEETLAQLQAVL